MRLTLLVLGLSVFTTAETVHYSYDPAGRLARAEYEGGKAISYTYDKAGNLLRREVSDSSGLASANAASYDPARILAPEAIVYAEGPNLATGIAVADTLELPTELLGTSVDVTDVDGTTRRAGLIYVTPGAVAYVVPGGTALGLASVVVHSGAGGDVTGSLQVSGISPGIFTGNQAGTGVAAAYLIRVSAGGDITRELLFDPVSKEAVALNLSAAGETYYLEMYGTGMRGSTGDKSATIDGKNVEVAGPVAHSVYAGLDQFNLGPFGPGFVGSGERNIAVTLDGQQANVVTVRAQ